MSTLTLAFLRPSAQDECMSRLAAAASKHGICHVELVFDGGLAFSIYHDRAPFLRQRSMSNPGYELVSLAVQPREHQAALQFCRSVVAEGYEFDHMGLYLATVHPGGCLERSSSSAKKTFCSKIITETLQFADVEEVKNLSPSATTPSRLYAAVKDSSRRVCHNFKAGAKPSGLTMPVNLSMGLG
jgi:hypothetical protein